MSSDLRRVFDDLSLVDKLLPLWIISAMILGILLSVYVPSSREAFNGAKVVGVSVPLAVGLIVMMIPPLCKVEWENFFSFFNLKKYLRSILISLVINWVICPFLMFGLAWLTLFDLDEYRTGIIMIGLARCIAMVLVWNEISDGDNSLCAVIVLLNSLLQIVLYAPYQIFFCYVITGDYHHSQGAGAGVTYLLVAQSVAFFLGIPLAIGFLIRLLAISTVGIKVYDSRILPFIGPWALIGLLYTIIVIFIETGNDFIRDIGSGLRCFVPLTVYFMITWFGTFFFLRWFLGRVSPREEGEISENTELLCGCEKQIAKVSGKWVTNCSASYSETITQTFTAASNNFELSLAIAISLYGSGSKESIAATFGPLLEVPILLILCFVAKYFKIKFLWSDVNDEVEEVIDMNNVTQISN
ncbi:uncharacterized protein AC631_05175 [Debaryomyces fabryi]|uniref:Arsenical-resistance protein n=1 Tax=Debaryomyces fabryi TaxID=58627 RepID=A0A0V1PSD5_9ASCO|nr:uncharacterized protein AC631_05175 [Debaryomyces fabryi]KRZ99073.1 hypothetical protein AC631_05175 [Debaryomyces fabryi]